MQTFVAVPILAGDVTLGTVCGASRRSVVLDHDAVAVLDLVADVMSHQLASIVDAASQRARVERAEVLALTDFLTGLPNRRAFSVRYEEELARSGRHGTPVALLLIDIDEFKSINDTHGHDGGEPCRDVDRTGRPADGRRSLSPRRQRGRPSMRSPTMLRRTLLVPPMIV